MTEPGGGPDSPGPPQPSWESAVAAEINRLAAEVERLSKETLKLGGRVNSLMKERDERQRHAQRRRG
jgi:hypothetical protein